MKTIIFLTSTFIGTHSDSIAVGLLCLVIAFFCIIINKEEK